eukprot:TRINITY_DN38769_c0_g1_i17.p1 TRINITY_DN38769_c0_g1~~TRINITY_DN38769_c0_g1_i17.p1  ORF type:complete len:480 (-),score=41.46 TRINITY_DN38769_c0_g1_i17:285-1724(-)
MSDGSWGADEELLLLEALDNHGPGNWGVIADVVGSKSQQQCMQHYLKIFIHHENYPLPLPTKEIESMDLQEVAKKVRESTRLSSDVNKAVLQGVNCPQIKADCYNNDSFTSRNQEYIKQNSRKRSQQELLDEEQPEGSYINPKMKFISNSMKKKKQQISLPKLLPDQHPIDSTGYNKFRQEFEPDYDLEAEAIVAEIEISPLDDVQIDLQVNSIDDKLKERLLQIYHRRQEARKQRGEGILSRQRSYVMSVSGGSKMQMGSLQSFPSGNAQETSRFDLKRAINISDFGKGVKNALRVFSKYVQHDEYNRLEEGLILEQNLRSRILELKELRKKGARTFAQGEEIGEVQARESEKMDSERLLFPTAVQGVISKMSRLICVNLQVWQQSQEAQDLLWSTLRYCPCVDKLFEDEVQLCVEMRLLPAFYLALKDSLLRECQRNGLMSRQEIKRYFRMDPSKCLKIHDVMTSSKSMSMVYKGKS